MMTFWVQAGVAWVNQSKKFAFLSIGLLYLVLNFMWFISANIFNTNAQTNSLLHQIPLYENLN